MGLSQEAISEGICSVETFSRIERGKTKIKGDTYKKIMERLERNTDKFYAVCSGEDVDLLDDVAELKMRLQSLIISLLIRFWGM